MNFFSLRIAIRYLISKKSTNAINIITGVTMTGMACGTMALILVLSVFNGFEGLVISLYQSFNPDLQVTAREGKVFTLDSSAYEELKNIEGVEYISYVLEENAILKYNNNEYIATIKGVDNSYLKVSDLEENLVGGEYLLHEDQTSYAVLGAGVAGALNVDLENPFEAISIYLPKRGKETMGLNPANAFTRKNIRPSGIFSIQQEFDNKYLLAPIEFVRTLLNYDSEISSLEIKVQPQHEAEEVKQKVAAVLGEGFSVKDRFEQNEFLYKIMRSEKWAVYAILALILVIAAFNIIGSLSMLVIEKTGDIATLKAMGATSGMIRNIFLLEGILTSVIGSFIGGLLAVIICLLQINFEILKLQGSGTFIIDAYPVAMKGIDFVLIGVTVITISMLTAWMPAHRAATQSAIIGEE